jgi:phytoene dehydrogenase-like protein
MPESSTNSTYDTIIIGAGMSGLAAGIRLAYYDRRVCILERHTTIGGLNSFYRLRGRNFDVGLHAVTNYYSSRHGRKGPFGRILRQLRFRWEDFAMAPQIGSSIAFPGVTLRFNNNVELLESEIARQVPKQKDAFRKLLTEMLDYDDLEQNVYDMSARKIVGEIVRDPLLVEMLLCPLMWYGNARERDMDWGQFCIMFRSIFLEGFGRPYRGVRLILKQLVRKYRELGGELKLRHGVDRIRVKGDRAVAVVLDDGRELEARNILSSAGWCETMRMCEDIARVDRSDHGRLSFIEAISILDRPPQKINHDETIVFFNDSPQFHWQRPDELCDLRTGVVCSPNNYAYEGENGAPLELPEGTLRITAMANYDRWTRLSDEEYNVQKLRWYDLVNASAVRFVPDFRGFVVDTDMFTPKTIHRFTWHDNGAVYGAPQKRLDGATHLNNLFICGTDQGFVGIVGAVFSGILIANKHLLRD